MLKLPRRLVDLTDSVDGVLALGVDFDGLAVTLGSLCRIPDVFCKRASGLLVERRNLIGQVRITGYVGRQRVGFALQQCSDRFVVPVSAVNLRESISRRRLGGILLER